MVAMLSLDVGTARYICTHTNIHIFIHICISFIFVIDLHCGDIQNCKLLAVLTHAQRNKIYI
jgi:hypothetical protein